TALYLEAVHVTSLSQTAPFIALAKIVMPANTNAVTNAMITDLRSVANPRKERYLFTHNLNSGQTDTLGDPVGESFPDIGGFAVTVPTWATKANVVATYAQLVVPAGSTRGGGLGVSVGGVLTPVTRYAGSGDDKAQRQTLVNAATIDIPANLRGTAITTYTRGNASSGS